MCFQINITKDILQRIEKLPAKLQAEFLLHLDLILKDGLTTTQPRNLKLDDSWFTACFEQPNDSMELKDGFVLKGYLRKRKKGKAAIYCTGYYEIKGGNTGSALGCNERFEVEKVKKVNKKDCIFLDKTWINKKCSDPKIVEELRVDLPVRDEFVPSSRYKVLRYLFYPDVDSVLAYSEHIRKFNSKAPFYPKHPGLQTYHIPDLSFDIVTKKHITLHDVMERFKGNDTIFIVNFVDEHDIFSHAQRDFSSLMAVHMKQIATCIKVTIIDLPICKNNSSPSFQEEFLKYYENNKLATLGKKSTSDPHPFSMVMARIRGKPSISRIMDFDLFDGCRDKGSPYKNKAKFQLNCRRIIHDVLGMVGFTCEYFSVIKKDFTKYNKYEAMGRLIELSQDTLVVHFNKESKWNHEKARQACLNLIGQGYPNVLMAQTEIEGGWIRLFCNGKKQQVHPDHLEEEMKKIYRKEISSRRSLSILEKIEADDQSLLH
ncbi:hypothetical protein QQ020_26075 [Fulvivirgaceae bacterium BMA12]|uniref:Uncharacterized protein n=1 Tax=Agaribacillus aureus TaxID=3051825 RepID=A0ABT8LCT1_9BACT|nr:hypothetical protein [Fulvivirgaceae bacterium BMA12]